MRGTRLLLLAVSAFVGCESLGKPKVDNPVFGEPPPRNAAADKQLTDSKAKPRRPDFSPVDDASAVNDENPLNIIRPLAGEDRPQAPQASVEPNDNEVVATVNGSPIFASEVLEPYAAKLAAAKKEISPEEHQQLRTALIKRDLPGHIDRRLLVVALRSTLKPQQIEMLDKHIAQKFQGEIERLQKNLKVDTKHDLQIELGKAGTSLANRRNAFANEFMVQQYLQLKSKDGPKVGREELVNWYQQHLDDYAISGAVKWQRIVISREGPNDRAALEKFNEAVAELKRGVDFGEVARRYSDGPSAADGGDWGDWMKAGTLTDKEIERALFELSVGVISAPFERDDSYQLVKVTDRKEPGRVQFAEAQAEIQKKLDKQDREQTIKSVLADLQRDAVVTTIFDQQAESHAERKEPANPFR